MQTDRIDVFLDFVGWHTQLFSFQEAFSEFLANDTLAIGIYRMLFIEEIPQINRKKEKKPDCVAWKVFSPPSFLSFKKTPGHIGRQSFTEDFFLYSWWKKPQQEKPR